MKIRSKILGIQGVLLFSALFLQGLFVVLLETSINPIIKRLDTDIDSLRRSKVLDELTLIISTLREDLQQMTESYIDTPNESATRRYAEKISGDA